MNIESSTIKPKKLKRVNIKLIDIEPSEDYQIRNVGALNESDAYIYGKLEKEDINQKVLDLRNGNKDYRFKPVDVIHAPEGSDKPYILTHGFHRYEAYKQFAKRSSYTIPAYIIEDEAEARRRAHRDNSEAKLVMPKRMITESAWQIVARGLVKGETKEAIAAELHISGSTLKKMEATLKRIREEGLFVPMPQPDYPREGQEVPLWKTTWQAMQGGKKEDYDMDFGSVAAQMVKLWKEDIISSYAEGDTYWFMEQATKAVKDALESEAPEGKTLQVTYEMKFIDKDF